MEVVASLSQGRTAAAQCGLFTHKSVPVIFEPPCIQIPSLSKLLGESFSICAWVSCSFFPSGLANVILCAFLLLPVLII